MKTAKWILGCILVFASVQAPQAAEEKSSPVKKPSAKSHPKILEVLGSVVNRKNPEIKVNSKMLIVDHLSLDVKDGSTVKVKLDEKRTVTAYGPTEFQIPHVSWEERNFALIILESGALRFEVEGHPFPFKLRSALFELEVPVGETIFVYDPKRALADAMVIRGELDFRALNAEESAKLTAGQKVTFLGVLDEGEISYDLLLEGRKIPKGRLLDIQSITKIDLQNYSSQLESRRRGEMAKANANRLNQEKAQKNKSLCRKPLGQFNQCLWKLQGKNCHRSRCAADGQWKDTQLTDSSSCTKTPKVAPCDY